ncbi:hypothetical protein C8R48DRAFT_739188 [Suillus tomentosus]|nr:hypothetical protein C8R48DRAFT_739188 [Suillus tomentosus]
MKRSRGAQCCVMIDTLCGKKLFLQVLILTVCGKMTASWAASLFCLHIPQRSFL